MTTHVQIDPDTGEAMLDRFGDVLECMEDHDGDCAGEIAYRESLSGTGTPMVRCDFHHNKRLQLQEEINERYPASPPRDWSPLDAGESWDEDY